MILNRVYVLVDNIEILLELLYFCDSLRYLCRGIRTEYFFFVGILTNIAKLFIDFASDFGSRDFVFGGIVNRSGFLRYMPSSL